jgi:branched-chain amino acid aminotransferase
VVFLDAVRREYIDELSGMNVFFVYGDGTLVTPPTNGTILPGITRDAVITLARDRGLSVVERPYSFTEWRADAASGALREAFACGTAAVVTPIGTVKWRDGELHLADGTAGEVTTQLRSELVGIQRGRIPDRHNWLRQIT